MFTIINTKIIFNAIFTSAFLASLVFGVIVAPTETKAQAYGGNINVSGYPSGQYDSQSYYPNNGYQNQNYYSTYPVAVPVYVPTTVSPAPTVYSNTTNPNAPTGSKAVAKAKTTDTTPAENTDSSKPDSFSSLTANAIFGDNSFLPSSLLQWVFFATLVAGAVFLVRKIYGGNEKYQATPMKHN